MDTLYERLCVLAERHGMTPNQLRVSAGLSPSTFGELKHGRQNDISRKTAQKIADALGITVEEVYADPNEENTKVTREQLKFALFTGDKEITEDMLNEVLNFAKFVEQREADKHNS